MKQPTRYDISGLIEAQFEPGSHGRVLKNLLGIKSKREIDRVEAKEQLRALEELSGIYDAGHIFTSADICKMHKIWLGRIYEWAGHYSQVNVSKGEFPFASAKQIPRLMSDLEKGLLKKNTPCRFASHEDIARAIAVVHTEIVLIHPFREGNGRVARILSTLMALQAGLPPLDFGGIKGKARQEYFAAVRAGLDNNYERMEKIFNAVIRRTLRIQK
jgi:cell filamentation protein